MEVLFTIPGLVRTKKNSKIATLVKTKRARLWRGELCNQKIICIENNTYQAWERDAVSYLIQQRQGMRGVSFPLTGRYNVKIVVYVPDRRRRDCLNLWAGVMDALTRAGVIGDDHHGIVAAHDGSRVFLDKARPRCDITISTMLD